MLFCSDAGFISDFPASDLYPPFWEEASTAHKGMVFLPLYDRNITLGYLITYLQEHLYEMLYFRTLTGHLSIALEAVRQRYLLSLASQKLDRLSITDALTGLYNRFGYARFHKNTSILMKVKLLSSSLTWMISNRSTTAAATMTGTTHSCVLHRRCGQLLARIPFMCASAAMNF